MSDPYWVRWSYWPKVGPVEARKLLVETGADHVLYGRKLYDDNGELEELRFYLLPMGDEEFEKDVVPLKNQQVYAIHKMK